MRSNYGLEHGLEPNLLKLHVVINYASNFTPKLLCEEL
jgi:hypothetical protein